MVSPCINSSFYEFDCGNISPGQSLSFLSKQRWGNALLLFQLKIPTLMLIPVMYIADLFLVHITRLCALNDLPAVCLMLAQGYLVS